MYSLVKEGEASRRIKIGRLSNAAFRAAILQTATKDIERTRIYPFNQHIFLDHLFTIKTTDRLEMPRTDQTGYIKLKGNPMIKDDALMLIDTSKDLESQPSTS